MRFISISAVVSAVALMLPGCTDESTKQRATGGREEEDEAAKEIEDIQSVQHRKRGGADPKKKKSVAQYPINPGKAAASTGQAGAQVGSSSGGQGGGVQLPAGGGNGVSPGSSSGGPPPLQKRKRVAPEKVLADAKEKATKVQEQIDAVIRSEIKEAKTNEQLVAANENISKVEKDVAEQVGQLRMELRHLPNDAKKIIEQETLFKYKMMKIMAAIQSDYVGKLALAEGQQGRIVEYPTTVDQLRTNVIAKLVAAHTAQAGGLGPFFGAAGNAERNNADKAVSNRYKELMIEHTQKFGPFTATEKTSFEGWLDGSASEFKDAILAAIEKIDSLESVKKHRILKAHIPLLVKDIEAKREAQNRIEAIAAAISQLERDLDTDRKTREYISEVKSDIYESIRKDARIIELRKEKALKDQLARRYEAEDEVGDFVKLIWPIEAFTERVRTEMRQSFPSADALSTDQFEAVLNAALEIKNEIEQSFRTHMQSSDFKINDLDEAMRRLLKEEEFKQSVEQYRNAQMTIPRTNDGVRNYFNSVAPQKVTLGAVVNVARAVTNRLANRGGPGNQSGSSSGARHRGGGRSLERDDS